KGSLGELACDPISGRICGHVDPDKVSPLQPYDDEGIEQVEPDARDNEQVHGSNVRRVVTQKGPPALTRWPRSLDHVSGHRRLGDLEAKLEQLAMNARCSPQWVLDAHPPDQCA